MIDCADLVLHVCDAFRTQLFELCLLHWREAVSYKSIICGLNYGCCE